MDRSMLGQNPPEHTRLRRLAAPGFSPRLMRVLRDVDREAGGRAHRRVAPATASTSSTTSPRRSRSASSPTCSGCEDADVAVFEKYGEVMASALDGVESFGHARRLRDRRRDGSSVFDRLFELRRRDPRDDLVTSLVAARDDDRMTSRELVAMCQVLLVAGFETTVNLISNAALALQRTPGAWQRLVEDPEIARLAVEETLRYDSPVQRTIRVALEDTELGRPRDPTRHLGGRAGRRRQPGPGRLRPARTSSCSTGSPTPRHPTISRSPAAPTSASAPRSRGSRPRSRCASWRSDSRACG